MIAFFFMKKMKFMQKVVLCISELNYKIVHLHCICKNMAENKRIIFVVNPISGTSGKAMVLKLIESNLDRSKYDYDIIKTKYQGHAAEIAKEAAEQGVDIVCAIGGDGTVNEIARSLVHTNTAMSIIPCGSGNGLARHLHIPVDPAGAIKVLNEGLIQPMDYGVINGHPFFCTCGVGFDAFISMEFAEAGKRGPLTYIENVLKNGLKYNPEQYEIDIEGEEGGDENGHQSYKAFLISCANASQYGNNAYIAPMASVRDGYMDVTIMEPFGVIEAPQIAVQMFNGTLHKNSLVKTLRCKKVKIRRTKPGAVHYDGDPVMLGKNIEVSIVPEGLLCVSAQTEGKREIVENIHGMIAEHFRNMYFKSENILQTNIQKTQRITQLNKEILQKLSNVRGGNRDKSTGDNDEVDGKEKEDLA